MCTWAHAGCVEQLVRQEEQELCDCSCSLVSQLRVSG